MTHKDDYLKFFSGLHRISNSRKERVFIDGREVVFIDNTIERDFTKKIQALCVELLRDNIFAKQFSLLYIYFEPDKSKLMKNVAESYAIAYMDKEDALKGERNIHFEIKAIYAELQRMGVSVDAFNSPEMVERFERTLNHELAHVLHFEEKQIQEMEIAVQQRLAKVLAQVQVIGKKNNVDIRLYLRIFLSLLHLEGLAKYCERRLNMKAEMSKTYVLAVESIVKKEMEEYMIQLNECMDGRITYDKFMGLPLVRGIPYDIGDVMVMTILLADHEMGVRKLTKLTTFGFVQKYEECCVVVGFTPMVSLTSGKGLFDYKRMVERVGKGR